MLTDWSLCIFTNKGLKKRGGHELGMGRHWKGRERDERRQEGEEGRRKKRGQRAKRERG